MKKRNNNAHHRVKLTLKDRIEGCLMGAAIGAELGWTWHVHTQRYLQVTCAEDLLNLKLEPVRPEEEKAYWKQRPYAQHYLYPRLTPLIEIGVRAYVDKRGRATPEDFARALRNNRAIAGSSRTLWMLFYTTQELLNEGCNPRISGMGTVPSGLVADAMPAVGIFHHSDPEYAYLDGVELASVCQPRLGADWAGLAAAAIAAAFDPNPDPEAIVSAVLDLAQQNNEKLYHELNYCVRSTQGWFADIGKKNEHINRWLKGFPCTQRESSPLAPNPIRFVLPLLREPLDRDPRLLMSLLLCPMPDREPMGETCAISGDTFAIETAAFRVKQEDMRLVKQVAQAGEIALAYEHPEVSVKVRYTLGPAHHFMEKHLTLVCPKAAALTRVSLGRLEFKGGDLHVLCYRHPDFDYYDDMPRHKMRNVKRPPDTEPVKTYFGRTAQGGFFTGLEMPFDTSTVSGNTVEISFAPSLRLKAGEELECEPAYLGVYRLGNHDLRAEQWKPTEPNQEAYGDFDGAAAGLTSPDEVKGELVLPRSCVVFGPLAKDDPRLAPEALRSVPPAIEIGGRRIAGQPREFNAFRELDLGDLLAPRDIEDEAAGLTAYVFIPFDVAKPGPVTFGLGADWWYEAWLDGAMISETVSCGGNKIHPPAIADFAVAVDASTGPHVLVVRFVRGTGSATLVVGGPADLRGGIIKRIQIQMENKTKAPGLKTGPLPAESAAMVAMTSAILGLNGKPRHGVKALACGWHCQMEQGEYTAESLAADLHALETIKECGLDGVSDSHPWGGETKKMNRLQEGDRYEIGNMTRQFLERARELGLTVVMWPTMNHTHPWNKRGRPFRPDQPEWLRGVTGKATPPVIVSSFRQTLANCLANEPFFEWLMDINRQALATGYYDAWCMDGDFWGTGAYYTSTVPVTCTAEHHRHLSPDANFACQRALDTLIADVRRQKPDVYIAMCRPPMDLGVWSNRQVDACFTLVETGGGASNLAAGDEIRSVSRIRVHHHFFPHWMDWPLLFPSYASGARPWPSGHFDYVMLSALSSSPNLLLYLPARTGIPEKDRAEIRRWLEWGRKNEAYLLVRKDLFDWPGPDRVDGSAHVVGDRGLVFLFNSGRRPLTGEFRLTEESIGLKTDGVFHVTQEYPQSNRALKAAFGQTVRWDVPAQTAAIIRVQPAD